MHTISPARIQSSSGKFHADVSTAGTMAPAGVHFKDAYFEKLRLHFSGGAGKTVLVKCTVDAVKAMAFKMVYAGGSKSVAVAPSSGVETFQFALPAEKLAGWSGVTVTATGGFTPWHWYGCTLTVK